MRVLDIDLDFFVHGVAYVAQTDADRLDPTDFPPWSLDEAVSFLEDRCGLTGKLPGFAVERHDEVFKRWRAAIDADELPIPFHVTHVDAHADLGQGDSAYVYIMSELLFEPPHRRRNPIEGGWRGLGEGNFLAFAIACRWISDIVYVFNEGGGYDIPNSVMEGFDRSARNIQLKAIPPDEINTMVIRGRTPEVARLEPPVPLTQIPYASFRADEPFDMICLSRSPIYTPEACDSIYKEIRSRFIDEAA